MSHKSSGGAFKFFKDIQERYQKIGQLHLTENVNNNHYPCLFFAIYNPQYNVSIVFEERAAGTMESFSVSCNKSKTMFIVGLFSSALDKKLQTEGTRSQKKKKRLSNGVLKEEDQATRKAQTQRPNRDWNHRLETIRKRLHKDEGTSPP